MSVVPGFTLLSVGLPFVVAGAAIALGLHGRDGKRRIEATVAVVVGFVLIVVGAIGYVVLAVTWSTRIAALPKNHRTARVLFTSAAMTPRYV